nr:hypothetical protein [Tanacetum cinerariifolium]
MTLELVDRSISHSVRVAEDVYVKVGTFHFSADFVVVDFNVDPRVPLILGRSFLKTGRALIDVFEGELTLRAGKEAITFNLDQTLRYSANYNDMMAKRIDVIDMACKEYSQEVLGNYLPEVRKELKICEAKYDKSSIDESPEVELKDLPPHLEYAFLEDDDKLPIIIAKDLSVEEKTALIAVLKSYKRAIAWKLSDIKGIDPEFCTHKIIMEEDFEPAVQHQRSVNPKIHDVIKQEVLKLLDAGLIYPISDSPWVIPVHCVPKKGGFTVVENEDNELILTRLVMGWRVCIDYQRMLKRCEDTNLYLNWEKSHFMVKEGIVIGHKISKQRIEVDKAKVDVITKLPHPITVKGIRSFLGHAGFYRKFIKDFSKIARPMTHPLEKDTPFIFSKECVEAFQTLKRKLTEAPILIAPDWDMPLSSCAMLATLLLVQSLGNVKINVSGQYIMPTAGDHRKVQLNELNELRDQAYENSLIYKEKTKRFHDSKIKDRVFNIGDRVLLFNSRLKIFFSKLKSRWFGPFTISHVYPYGTVELSQPDGPNFKVNGHRLKHYFGDDVPKLVVPDLQTFPKDH